MGDSPDGPATYEIHVEGPVSESLVELFPALVRFRFGILTVLSGPVRDGSELVAIIDRLVSSNSMPVLIKKLS